jgi:acyl-CoA synthetase (NDP forming)
MSFSVLSPRSIAVIGATDKEGSVGRAITSNIVKDFKGSVFPVNPTKDLIFGIKTYKSVVEVPQFTSAIYVTCYHLKSLAFSQLNVDKNIDT